MTKKLKTKLKRSIIVTAGITTISAICLAFASSKTGLFVMSKDKESDLSAAETAVVENTGITTIAEDGVIVCDSIVQGVKDNNLSDGTYTFRVNGKTSTGAETKDYAVELINYYDDITYSLASGETTKTISLGDTSSEYKMLIVKYHKNLTIDSGVTVTASTYSNGLTYKKGMYLCVMGELVNNGTISMTARGTYNAPGENLYLWKNNDSTFEYVPQNGAAGVPAKRPHYNGVSGVKGNDGTNRGTGSGGQGASIINTNNNAHGSYIGASTGGTTYSGGNGTGGMVRCNSSALGASSTAATTTKGGNGSAYDSGGSTYYFAGGGAGVQGGSTSYCRLGSSGTQTKGQDGTGGLLVVYANSIFNDGKIEANGTNGAGGAVNLPGSYRGAVGGGGSRAEVLSTYSITKHQI